MVSTAPTRAGYAGTHDTLPRADGSETVTLAEVGRALNIRPTKLYELAQADALPVPALRVGRTYRFSRRLLEALLDGTYTRPDQP